jgi:hypothetical protein
MRKSRQLNKGTWLVSVDKIRTYTSLCSSSLFYHLKPNFQWIPKKRSFGKLSIFNKWIKVVVDKPLKNYIERDAKRDMLCLIFPTDWPLWSYNKAKLSSFLVYQVLWERIQGKIFLFMKMMTDKMCLKAIKASYIWSSWQHGIGL